MASLGEKRVRVEFNPSKQGNVDQLKQKSAELIDLVEQLRGADQEQNRLIALAQTKYEEAAMYAVKAATA
jgi:hypothetical protein